MPDAHVGEIFALGAAACWAIGPLIAHEGVAALGLVRFSQLRFLISAIVLLAFSWVSGSLVAIDIRSTLMLGASGIVGVALGEACLFQAVYLTGPRIASIIFSLHAPITAFVGAAIFGEEIATVQGLGVVMTVTGVTAAISFKTSAERSGGIWHKSANSSAGLLLAFVAVGLQVTGALIAKAAMPHAPPVFANFVRMGCAAIAFVPVYLALRERDRVLHATDLRIVAYSAAVSTIGGTTLFLAALAATEVFRAVVVASLSPALYIIIMSATRRERFSFGTWLGTAVAVTGAILSALPVR